MPNCPTCGIDLSSDGICFKCSATKPIRAVPIASPARNTVVIAERCSHPNQPIPAGSHPTNAASAQYARPTAINYPSDARRSSKAWLPWAIAGTVVVGMMVLAVVAGGLYATGRLSPPPKETASDQDKSTQSESPADASEKTLVELKKEVRELEDRERKLKETISREQLKLEDTQKQIEEQQQLLEKLISTYDRLKPWQDVHVVIGEPQSEVLAIRREASGQFRYFDKIDPELSSAAILVAHKANSRWIAMHDSQSAQQLREAFAPEKQLDANLTRSLQNLLTPSKLLEDSSNNQRFITFRLRNQTKPQLGIYCGTASDSLNVQLLGEPIKSLHKSLIAAGTARLVSHDELKQLDDGEFLDAALLEAISALQNYRKERDIGSARIAIRVQAGSGQSFAYVLQNLLRSNSTVSEISRATSLIESQLYSKLLGLNSLDRNFEVVAPQNMADLVAKSILPRAVAATIIKFAGSRSFGRHQISRLTEDALNDYLDHQEDYLSYVDFFLNVTVSPPAEGGEYFLDLKLTDARRNIVIYAVAGDRFFRAPGQLYFPASGQLAYLRAKEGVVPPDKLVEANSPLQRGGLFSASKGSTGGLVIFEGRGGSSLYYRTLLGSRLDYIAADEVQIDVLKEEYLNAAPAPDRIRLAAHRIVRSALPPSGIVRRVSADNVATISIGGQAGLKVGDRLRLARNHELSVGQWATYDVATPITVNKVSENEAEVSCVPSGLEHLFETDHLQRGDIVYAHSRDLPIVVVEPFQFVGCADQKIASQVRWDVPTRRSRLTTMANAATEVLHERIGTAISALNIPQVSYKSCPTKNYGSYKVESIESYGRFLPPDARITRVVGGRVAITSNNDCQFEFHIREPVSNQLIERFAFTLDTAR